MTNEFCFRTIGQQSNLVSWNDEVHWSKRQHPAVFHQLLKVYWNDLGLEPLLATKVQFYGELVHVSSSQFLVLSNVILKLPIWYHLVFVGAAAKENLCSTTLLDLCNQFEDKLVCQAPD